MSAKAIVTGALLLAALGGWSARAAGQTPEVSGQAPDQLPTATAQAPMSPISSVIPPPSQVPAVNAGLPPGSVPDPWITYDRPGCCGPMGGNGPIGYEGYVRTGVSIPMGNNLVQESLNPGWQVTGGARSLFFNRATTAAWTADTGLGYTYNDGGRPDRRFNVLFPFNVVNNNVFPATNTLVFAPIPVTIRAYDRTAVHLAGGFEKYFGNPAYCPGTHFRIGGDVGGRWGASRLELNDVTFGPNNITYRHLYDVYGTVYLSLHSDLELPISPCTTFIAGFRAEWAQNWSDILKDSQPRLTANLQEVNLLLNFGLRY
jgi:hypothetical protein